MTLSLLTCQGLPILTQLALEEAYLRVGNGNLCILNEGSTPAVVLGISQKPELVVHPKTPIPLIRRFSGGGTVVVDENTLFVTFIGNSLELKVPHNPEGAHQFAAAIYKELFQSHPFSLHENDYRLNNKKVGGNAQYFTKNRFLHHTSFLYDWSNERMNYLLMPPKMPLYRQNRPHEEFLTPLHPHFENRGSLLNQLATLLKKKFVVQEIALKEIESLLDQPHRKSVSIIRV